MLCIGMALWAGAGMALADCVQSDNILISSCDRDLSVQLIQPASLDGVSPEIAVTGTYSSGDRLGIEGLAVIEGEILSRRLQGWDGVLIIGQDGQPELFNARDVRFEGRSYNIKDPDQGGALLGDVAAAGASMMQSHLLISDSVLDLRNLENAPVFYRRLFYVAQDGSFGLWQPDARLTLYDAAVMLQDELQPRMALNLDMGAYDFCRFKNGQDCGRLTVPMDRLTNILTFTDKAGEDS